MAHKRPCRWFSWLIGLVLAFSAVHCSPRLPELKEIEEKRRELARIQRSEGPSSSNFLEAAFRLARAEEAFAQKYPNYAQTPELLIEAATLYANHLADPRKAVQLLERIQPEAESYAEALFYTAFIYENQLSDTAQARFLYERFLKLYPNHRLAEQVKGAIQTLGKSPEEILQYFEKHAPPP